MEGAEFKVVQEELRKTSPGESSEQGPTDRAHAPSIEAREQNRRRLKVATQKFPHLIRRKNTGTFTPGKT